MKKIGITGGIGSGKSVVSQILRINGIPVYDSDSRAKALQVENKEVVASVKALLGEESYLTDGSLNKPYIAQKIFGDKALLAAMNAIVHPAVRHDFNAWVETQKNNGIETIGMESALLYQAGLEKTVDEVWVIESPLEMRIGRAIKRDKANREQIEARIRNQRTEWPESAKIIYNDERESLIKQVLGLLNHPLKGGLE
ncbi:MAG: dephospho-CoA kinase [Bacteroidales bacterium]|nr:dephospho-CoA kinase [Candidatus Physcocola equi]